MDRVLVVYVIMGLYLCGVVGAHQWGLLVFCTCVSLTGLVGIILYELVTIFMI